MIKGGVVLAEDLLIEVLPAAWELLLEPNQEVAACAATFIIIASIRVPNPVAELLQQNLNHQDPAVRISSLLRYQILWSQRYLAVNRMEEGAHLTLRVPPPSIEFTLPSPKIGIESLPVVDSPWEPLVKSKVEDVTIGQDSHVSILISVICPSFWVPPCKSVNQVIVKSRLYHLLSTNLVEAKLQNLF